jgi:eukaryotic-like serine/threonine-protein kinase
LLHLCPTCRRRFELGGFCPFDGTALVAGGTSEQGTLVSMPMPAQPAAAVTKIASEPAGAPRPSGNPPRPSGNVPITPDGATQLEIRRRTFPLTPAPPPARPSPSPSPVIDTGELTSARKRPTPEAAPAVGRPPSDPPQVRVLSASENPAEALELFRGPSENEYDRLVGQTLDGRYYVEAKIGEGGMGVVFRARHSVIERPLAIKVLKREAMRDHATIRRFVQEAKAASRIGHPNIVDVTDFGTTPDGMTYSVMEFVPGMTLGSAIRHGAPFIAMRAIRITAQIARALAAAHDKGIVHRDLKPENVFLLDRDGRQDFVKIVDFGIAKVTPPPGKSKEPRLTRAGSVFGTPEYMAPEQAAGRSDTDGRVDIYALGVILYEMLCGRVPHRGDSMVRTLAMQMLDPIEPPSRVRPDLQFSPELESIVMRALVKKREQRYQTMGELLEALDTTLPAAIGQSVTGSPVYTLAALPPGADPGVVPALPAAPLRSSEAMPIATPRRAAADAVTPIQPVPVHAAHAVQPITRRVRDEPEFTADDRPVSFDHVFTEDLLPARSRRWPLLLLFAMIVGGAAGAVALVIKSRGAVLAEARLDAAVVTIVSDAGVPPEPDATEVVVVQALDAAPADAELVALPVADAPAWISSGGSDAGMVTTPNGRGTIVVQVLTKPEGANLYQDGTYRGPGGAQLEEPFGSRRTITCTQTGYKPGTVEVVFDGNTEAVLCVLQRIKLCVDNLKNPFDPCEEPGAPQVPPQQLP